jgi:hypothetical protein
MGHDVWVALFAAMLVELRPQLTAKMALMAGEKTYTAEDTDPKAAARAYHAKQWPAPRST